MTVGLIYVRCILRAHLLQETSGSEAAPHLSEINVVMGLQMHVSFINFCGCPMVQRTQMPTAIVPKSTGDSSSDPVQEFQRKSSSSTKGEAVGTHMGPSYACLFVGFVEQSLLRNYTGSVPLLFFRYIDDHIDVASCSREELERFINFANTFHPALIFTETISDTSLPFLDLSISDEVFYSRTLQISSYFRDWRPNRLGDRFAECLCSARINEPNLPVAIYFNSPSHSPGDMSILGLFHCQNRFERRPTKKSGELLPTELEVKHLFKESCVGHVDDVACPMHYHCLDTGHIVLGEDAHFGMPMLLVDFQDFVKVWVMIRIVQGLTMDFHDQGTVCCGRSRLVRTPDFQMFSLRPILLRASVNVLMVSSTLVGSFMEMGWSVVTRKIENSIGEMTQPCLTADST
eukprot:g43687.t1